MIRGQVLNREPIIELELSSATNKPKRITAVIDTGYSGYLTLPDNLVSQFNLPFAGYRTATLADGTVIRLQVFLGTVQWHGGTKDVLISQAAGTPLIGMALLEGSRLTMEATNGGDIVIEEIP